MRITPGNWYFILAEKLANGGIQIWCELPQVKFVPVYLACLGGEKLIFLNILKMLNEVQLQNVFSNYFKISSNQIKHHKM